MAAKGRGSDVGQNPILVRILTAKVKKAVSIPVIAKMTPNITHIEEPAIAAVEGGADAIAAINTIKSVTMKRRSEVSGKTAISGYSGKAIKPIAQRFILDMRKDKQLKDVPLSGIDGKELRGLSSLHAGVPSVGYCSYKQNSSFSGLPFLVKLRIS